MHAPCTVTLRGCRSGFRGWHSGRRRVPGWLSLEATSCRSFVSDAPSKVFGVFGLHAANFPLVSWLSISRQRYQSRSTTAKERVRANEGQAPLGAGSGFIDLPFLALLSCAHS